MQQHLVQSFNKIINPLVKYNCDQIYFTYVMNTLNMTLDLSERRQLIHLNLADGTSHNKGPSPNGDENKGIIKMQLEKQDQLF